MEPLLDICYRVVKMYHANGDEFMFEELVYIFILGTISMMTLPRLLRDVLQ